MPSITLLYARGHTVAGLAIRHFDRWGAYSHTGVLDGDRVLESRMFRGVVSTPASEFGHRYRNGKVEPVSYDCPDAEAGLAWARTQIGKPYDYRAIFGNLLRVNWAAEEAHHCHEFAEGVLLRSGLQRFRLEAWRITPTMGYQVL